MESTPEAGRRDAPVFTPEAVDVINRAYERALATIGGDRAHGNRRADLAKHIMDLARDGEHDEDKLCSRAVSRLMNGGVSRNAG
jgi:hypothetical protein